MTEEQKKRVIKLHYEGKGAKKISSETGISVNTVKSFLARNPNLADSCPRCLQCDAVLELKPHTKEKKFCSDSCRNAWWKEHPEMRKKKKAYSRVCPQCGLRFDAVRPGSVYCSRACYADARRKSHD